MATLSESLFPPSNRRRCVKGRPSYLEPSEHFIDELDIANENNDFNSGDFNCLEDDGDEMDITIDLSAFLNENPSLAAPVTEDPVHTEENLSHSTFRVTSSKVDIPSVAVGNVSQSEASFGSVLPQPLTDNTSVPEVSPAIETLSKSAVILETPQCELSGKENVNLSTEVISMPESCNKFPLKPSNQVILQDLNQTNLKLFGKYPVVHCERLDIEKFVKNNNIKLGNWPLPRKNVYKTKTINRSIFSKRLDIAKAHKIKKTMFYRKSISDGVKKPIRPVKNNIFGETFEKSNILIHTNKQWEPEVTTVVTSISPLNSKAPIKSWKKLVKGTTYSKKVLSFVGPNNRKNASQIRKAPIITSVNKMGSKPITFPFVSKNNPSRNKQLLPDSSNSSDSHVESFTVIEPYIEHPETQSKSESFVAVPIEIIPSSDPEQNISGSSSNNSLIVESLTVSTVCSNSNELSPEDELQSDTTTRNKAPEETFEDYTKNAMLKAQNIVVDAITSVFNGKMKKPARQNAKKSPSLRSTFNESALLGCQTYNSTLNDMLFGFASHEDDYYATEFSTPHISDVIKPIPQEIAYDTLQSNNPIEYNYSKQSRLSNKRKMFHYKGLKRRKKMRFFRKRCKPLLRMELPEDSDTLSASEGGSDMCDDVYKIMEDKNGKTEMIYDSSFEDKMISKDAKKYVKKERTSSKNLDYLKEEPASKNIASKYLKKEKPGKNIEKSPKKEKSSNQNMDSDIKEGDASNKTEQKVINKEKDLNINAEDNVQKEKASSKIADDKDVKKEDKDNCTNSRFRARYPVRQSKFNLNSPEKTSKINTSTVSPEKSKNKSNSSLSPKKYKKGKFKNLHPYPEVKIKPTNIEDLMLDVKRITEETSLDMDDKPLEVKQSDSNIKSKTAVRTKRKYKVKIGKATMKTKRLKVLLKKTKKKRHSFRLKKFKLKKSKNNNSKSVQQGKTIKSYFSRKKRESKTTSADEKENNVTKVESISEDLKDIRIDSEIVSKELENKVDSESVSQSLETIKVDADTVLKNLENTKELSAENTTIAKEDVSPAEEGNSADKVNDIENTSEISVSEDNDGSEKTTQSKANDSGNIKIDESELSDNVHGDNHSEKAEENLENTVDDNTKNKSEASKDEDIQHDRNNKIDSEKIDNANILGTKESTPSSPVSVADSHVSTDSEHPLHSDIDISVDDDDDSETINSENKDENLDSTQDDKMCPKIKLQRSRRHKSSNKVGAGNSNWYVSPQKTRTESVHSGESDAEIIVDSPIDLTEELDEVMVLSGTDSTLDTAVSDTSKAVNSLPSDEMSCNSSNGEPSLSGNNSVLPSQNHQPSGSSDGSDHLPFNSSNIKSEPVDPDEVEDQNIEQAINNGHVTSEIASQNDSDAECLSDVIKREQKESEANTSELALPTCNNQIENGEMKYDPLQSESETTSGDNSTKVPDLPVTCDSTSDETQPLPIAETSSQQDLKTHDHNTRTRKKLTSDPSPKVTITEASTSNENIADTTNQQESEPQIHNTRKRKRLATDSPKIIGIEAKQPEPVENTNTPNKKGRKSTSTPAKDMALPDSTYSSGLAKNSAVDPVSTPVQNGHKTITPAKSPTLSASGSKSGRGRFDVEAVTVPLQNGWFREIVHRGTETKDGRKLLDVYYFTPNNTKLRSMVEIKNWLLKNKCIYTESNFTFAKQKVYREPFEVERSAKQKSSIAQQNRNIPKKPADNSTDASSSRKQNGLLDNLEKPSTSTKNAPPSKKKRTLEKPLAPAFIMEDLSAITKGITHKEAFLENSKQGRKRNSTVDEGVSGSETTPVVKKQRDGKNLGSADSSSECGENQMSSESSSSKRSLRKITKKIPFDNSYSELMPNRSRTMHTRRSSEAADYVVDNAAKSIEEVGDPVQLEKRIKKFVSPTAQKNKSSKSSDNDLDFALAIEQSEETDEKSMTEESAVSSTSTQEASMQVENTSRNKKKGAIHSKKDNSLMPRPCTSFCSYSSVQIPMVRCKICLCMFHASCIPNVHARYQFCCVPCAIGRLKPKRSENEIVGHVYPHNFNVSLLVPKIEIKEVPETKQTPKVKCITVSRILASKGRIIHAVKNKNSNGGTLKNMLTSTTIPQPVKNQIIVRGISPSGNIQPKIIRGIAAASSSTAVPSIVSSTGNKKIAVPISQDVTSVIPLHPKGTFNSPDANLKPYLITLPPKSGLHVRNVIKICRPMNVMPHNVSFPQCQATINTSETSSIFESQLSQCDSSVLDEKTKLVDLAELATKPLETIKDGASVETVNNCDQEIELNSVNELPVCNSSELDDNAELQVCCVEPELQSTESQTKVVECNTISCGSEKNYDDEFEFMKMYECLNLIVKNLRVCDLLVMKKVCKTWDTLISDDRLWKSVGFDGVRIKDWNECLSNMLKYETREVDFTGIDFYDQKFCKEFLETIHKFTTAEELTFKMVPSFVFAAVIQALPELKALHGICLLDKTSKEINWPSVNDFKLSCLQALTQIKKLQINTSTSSIHLDDSDDSKLPLLPMLKHLALTGFKFHSFANLQCIDSLQNLTILELGDCCHIEPELYNALKKLIHLTFLRLENGGTTNDGLAESLAEMKNLETLELMNFRIPQSLSSSLESLEKLTHFDIFPNIRENAEEINYNALRAVSKCKYLKNLFWGLIAIEDTVPSSLVFKNSIGIFGHNEIGFEELFLKLLELLPHAHVDLICVPETLWSQYCATRKNRQ